VGNPIAALRVQMGFDQYLTKPCNTEVLLDLINGFKRSRTPPARCTIRRRYVAALGLSNSCSSTAGSIGLR
jgi:DNA-binding response OmpR family regulator